ncbi:GNAT family N-acetyltransferase [Phenylobacterium sp.]|uniref:GNAT family N-acetyltransferase n=1 Tax=Phenylobacterium sp. TaxID=1871053 RepID=UPI0035B2C0C9
MEAGLVESLERATVAAVAPPEVMEMPGWLLAFDDGTIGRARSAVPLRHDVSAAPVPAILEAYAARGLPPVFRIPDTDALAPLRAVLAAEGLAPGKPTLVKIGDVARLAAFSGAAAEILDSPDAGWGEVFLGPGFDPVDGAHRVRVLSRSPGAAYGVVRVGDRAAAVGVASFGHGWMGIHGMRTAVEHRGQGHAGHILAAFGRLALARGVARVFLQVEEPNPARSLYRKAGFQRAWTYHYWSR